MKTRVASIALASILGLSACSTTNSESTPDTDGTTVDTVLGEITVPEKVDSVVVLEGRRDLDIALSLDLPVVGYPYEEAGSLDLETPLAEPLERAKQNGAEELFSADEVDLEAVAAADPDVIITRSDDAEPILDELTTIAPVLAIGDQDTSTWQDDLRLVAEATGRQDRASELIAEYDDRASALSEQYAEVLEDNAFVPMSFNGQSFETRPNRLLSIVLRDVGASPSRAFQDALDGDDVEYSNEQVIEGFGDADGIVALVNDPVTWTELQDDALYNRLSAVERGHVVRSDKQTHEGGPITAQHALDVVEELLQKL